LHRGRRISRFSVVRLHSKKPILVTGGAGYIGSHVVLQLVAAGERVVVVDDLSTGFADAVVGAELVVSGVGDEVRMDRLLRERRIDTVMHFAARTIVPESVTDPLRYYGNNTCSTRNLLACCARAGVRHFVFSSTAAVYGVPDGGLAREDSPTLPINPYGTSKLMSEWMLRDLAAAGGPAYVALRYFNVAGSDPQGRIGQSTTNATLLTKVACEVAVGRRPHVCIFGCDYETPDGTGVRDYIHVDDLARAHLDALAYLREGGAPVTLNCGYGHGYSVREVLAAVGRANGAPIRAIEQPRRPGDPPALVAEAGNIRRVLGWRPRCDDLDLIARTALIWERKLHERRLAAAHGHR
jgi:UDP-glucose 4-epimerase